MMTATVWRTCPSCGASFEQPDDPGRKRVYCSRACQQAAYRTRKQHAASNGPRGGQNRNSRDGRGEQRAHDDGWSSRHSGSTTGGSRSNGGHSRSRAGDSRSNGGENRSSGGQYGSWSGPRPGAAGSSGARPGDTPEQARARRRMEALIRKAASTPFPAEAAACRAKAEQLRLHHRL
jgi:hypothetical protein